LFVALFNILLLNYKKRITLYNTKNTNTEKKIFEQINKVINNVAFLKKSKIYMIKIIDLANNSITIMLIKFILYTYG